MINLIPSNARSAVVKEYWVRVISVWLFIFSAAGTIVILFALPVYVLVTTQVEGYAKDASEVAARVADYDLSASSLVRANVMAQKIFELRQVDNFSEVTDLFESLQGNGIILIGYEFSRVKGELSPVMIKGKASTRQELADFRTKLLSQDRIEDAILPISNLTKDKDIDFTISVTFKKNEK